MTPHHLSNENFSWFAFAQSSIRYTQANRFEMLPSQNPLAGREGKPKGWREREIFRQVAYLDIVVQATADQAVEIFNESQRAHGPAATHTQGGPLAY